MTFYTETCTSVSISEGVKGVRILITFKYGKEPVEFVTDGNKFKQVK